MSGAPWATGEPVFPTAHRRNCKVPAPPDCTVPGAIADPAFLMPMEKQLWVPLPPIPTRFFDLDIMLPYCMKWLPTAWSRPPVRGERFINFEAAMDRIKAYGLLCGFAVDCFNPESVTTRTFQCAHSQDTIQLPGTVNYCANTRSILCPFRISLKKLPGSAFEICEFFSEFGTLALLYTGLYTPSSHGENAS
jgi:hypothetical protein